MSEVPDLEAFGPQPLGSLKERSLSPVPKLTFLAFLVRPMEGVRPGRNLSIFAFQKKLCDYCMDGQADEGTVGETGGQEAGPCD